MILNEIVNHKKELVMKKLEGGSKFPRDKFFVIGEFKKASPSKGVIEENFNVDEILNSYENLPIDIYSVLTEEKYFLGNKEILKEVKSKGSRPILRKDFIVHPYEVYETKEMGSDFILLIVGVLGEWLGEFYALSKLLGLEALVEVHNKEELEIALKYDCDVIGINNRDLKTFKVDLNTTKELAPLIPKGKIIISESGISSIDDIEKVKEYGANGVLIGETFMRNYKDSSFINEFKRRMEKINDQN
ncbi:MAG: indole-3-glycerol phosphate synthase TrpC [Clostridium sp.]